MCGIVGIVGTSAVNQRLYDALTVLQHRGQDAAGIATLRRRRAVRAQGQWPGARRVPAASHARAQRQRRHRPRALPDGGLRRRLRSAAVLRQCALRHLPWAQRQSHQRDGARRDPDPRGPAPPQHHLRLGGAAERVRFRAAAGRDRAHHARGRLCRPERPVPPLPRRLCRGRDDHRPRHTRLSRSERHPPAGAR